jgi:hypothetical protein
MSITFYQSPLYYTPSNAQHAYNLGSTLSGNTDFRYVVDIWVNPRETTAEKIGRIKIAPNTFGYGIFDIGDILKNYLKPNPRSEAGQRTRNAAPNSITGVTGAIITNSNIISGLSPVNTNSVAYVPSNAFNTNDNYELLPHVVEYRIIAGEEYTTATGTTIQICTDPSIPESTVEFVLTTEPTDYVGDPNTVEWTNLAENPTWAVTNNPGWSYEHISYGGSVISSGSGSTSAGSFYTAASLPLNNDFLYVTELATGCITTFQWNCDTCETNGWNLISTYCPPCYTNLGEFITIWPGVQENKTNFNYNNIYWSGQTNGNENFKYWELYKYKFYPFTGITETQPAQFLTTFGDELFTATIDRFGTSQTTDRARRRYHHPECPIVLSNFFKDFNDQYVTGNVNSLGFNYSTTQDGDYQVQALSSLYPYGNYDTSPKNRIVYSVPFNNTWAGGKAAFWNQTQGNLGNPPDRISEVVEYYFWDADCLSDPQHFLFLNRRGVWDTYTFDRKNIKTYNKEISFYGQGLIRNNPIYNPFFYDKRDVIYDQQVVEEVEAQSNFMVENDRVIVEELFLSTSVYLIKENYYFGDPAAQYSKTPYLIPVVITSTSLQEYKQRYNKLFQYTLTYRYNPNQLFRSNL